MTACGSDSILRSKARARVSLAGAGTVDAEAREFAAEPKGTSVEKGNGE